MLRHLVESPVFTLFIRLPRSFRGITVKKRKNSHVKFSNYDFIIISDLQRYEKVIRYKLRDGRKVAGFLMI